MAEKIGAQIRRLREARGWSLVDLARESGVEKGTINKIETGKRKQPHRSTIKVLLESVTRPSKVTDGQTGIIAAGGNAGIEDHLGAIIAHVKTLTTPKARSEFIRAVTSLLAALEHARPAASSGTTEDDGH